METNLHMPHEASTESAVRANPINVAGIDHVVIRVRDIRRMITFYCEVLGCRLERGPGENGLAQLRAGQSLIDLIDAAGPLGRQGGRAPAHDAPNMDHLALQVRPWNTGVIVAYLNEHGINPGKVVRRYGAAGTGPSIYLEDPEGNNVELKGVASA